MIKFSCQHCNKKISVSPVHSGKKGKCPNCKNVVIVPQANSPAEVPDMPLDIELPSQYSSTNTSPADTTDAMPGYGQVLKTHDTENPPVRKLPWFIDIFLYPMNMSGLVNLAIFWILPLLVSIAARSLSIPFSGWIGYLLIMIVSAYMFYFFIECIQDSALGGIRAPENIANLPNISDIFYRAMEIIACSVIFWGPVGFYFMFSQKMDRIFWPLLGYGIFFFPMGLLAVVMFNSSAGFNPFIWIASIFSTFFQYGALVLCLCGLTWLFPKTANSLPVSPVFIFLFRAIFIYFAMVNAHLLGRFYYRNAEKLNWDV